MILCLLIPFPRPLSAAPPSPHVVADPPLSPAEQIKKFHLPPGFEIQLVAAEPEIKKFLSSVADSLYESASVFHGGGIEQTATTTGCRRSFRS